MAKLKPEDKKAKKVERVTPKKVWILSKASTELTLTHSLVCRIDQKCYCKFIEKDGVMRRIPASIHVVAGV